MVDAARHALELVQGMLQGAVPTAPVAFAWNTAVLLWCRALLPQARRCQVRLVVDTSIHGTVHGRTGELRRVVENLVSNAIKYTPPGQVVSVRTVADVDRVGVAIEDAGPGIPEDLLPRVFEPGVQGVGAKPGYGLGLSIVQRICREHGGQASVENTQHGSRFVAWFPRAEVAEVPAPVP